MEFEVIGTHVIPVESNRERRRRINSERNEARSEDLWSQHAARQNRITLQRKREDNSFGAVQARNRNADWTSVAVQHADSTR